VDEMSGHIMVFFPRDKELASEQRSVGKQTLSPSPLVQLKVLMSEVGNEETEMTKYVLLSPFNSTVFCSTV